MILCFPSQNTLSTQFFVIKCIYFIDGLTHFLTIDCPYFSRDCREIYQDFAIIEIQEVNSLILNNINSG